MNSKIKKIVWQINQQLHRALGGLNPKGAIASSVSLAFEAAIACFEPIALSPTLNRLL